MCIMADDKNTIHTPKTFSLEIEKVAFDKRCTHLEAISIYCEKIGDWSTIKNRITNGIKWGWLIEI